jgi:predicted ester cyclase
MLGGVVRDVEVVRRRHRLAGFRLLARPVDGRADEVPLRSRGRFGFMGIDGNKALARRFYEEVWDAGNVDVANEVFAVDYVRHDLPSGEAEPGGSGQATIARQFRAAFPDFRMRVNLVLAEDDLVAGRWTTERTNTGSWGGRPPTGRRATFAGVNIFRIRDGKVVELWNHRDDLGLMEQLGAEIYAGAAPTDEDPVGPPPSRRRDRGAEVVGEGRFELPRPCGHRILRLLGATHGSRFYASSCVVWCRSVPASLVPS